MNRCRVAVVCLILVGVLVVPSSLFAQTSAENVVEISASVGVSGGFDDELGDLAELAEDFTNLVGGPIDFDAGSDTKWNFGVAGAYGIRSNVMVGAEIVRTRLASPRLTVSGAPISALEFNASLLEFTAGAQYLVPVNDRVTPFVGAGLGLARSSFSIKEDTFNILDVDVSDNHFTVNIGGGARIFISPRWGIKPEVKLVHTSGETWVRSAVGVFFQLGS